MTDYDKLEFLKQNNHGFSSPNRTIISTRENCTLIQTFFSYSSFGETKVTMLLSYSNSVMLTTKGGSRRPEKVIKF